jgi:F1F0 ATPase subunit 2
LAFISGVALGILFFGGLWLTVKKLVTAKKPALLFLGSLLLRVCATLIGFYYVSQGNWQRMLVCLVGFITARFIMMHLTKKEDEKQLQLKNKMSHEA